MKQKIQSDILEKIDANEGTEDSKRPSPIEPLVVYTLVASDTVPLLDVGEIYLICL
jgi:hypothetical protein